LKSLNRLIVVCCFAFLVACSSGDDEGSVFDSGAGAGAAVITGNINVSVSGLSGSLWLTLNDELLPLVTASGSFTTPVTLNTSDPYDLRVFNQPNSQNCAITNGMGIHPGTTITISVVCGGRSFGGGAYNQNIDATSVVQMSISVRDYDSQLAVQGLFGNDFEVFVDGITLGETTIDAAPLLNHAFDPTPFIDIDTHILVDVSSSISEPELTIIKSALQNMLYKNSVSQLLSNQDVALSSFSGGGTFTEHQALTTDALALSTAVGNLSRGGSSTAMIESVDSQLGIMQPLNLASGIVDYSHVILITDGSETAAPGSTFCTCSLQEREVFIVALDVTEADPVYEKLKEFSDSANGDSLIFPTSFSNLESTLNTIQNIVSTIPDSFYFVTSALPMRDGVAHQIDRKIASNIVDFTFFSDVDVTGFSDATPTVKVDGRKNAGQNSVTLFATTFHDNDPTNYAWQILSGPATISSITSNSTTSVLSFSAAGNVQIQIDDLNNGENIVFNVDDTGFIF